MKKMENAVDEAEWYKSKDGEEKARNTAGVESEKNSFDDEWMNDGGVTGLTAVKNEAYETPTSKKKRVICVGDCEPRSEKDWITCYSSISSNTGKGKTVTEASSGMVKIVGFLDGEQVEVILGKENMRSLYTLDHLILEDMAQRLSGIEKGLKVVDGKCEALKKLVTELCMTKAYSPYNMAHESAEVEEGIPFSSMDKKGNDLNSKYNWDNFLRGNGTSLKKKATPPRTPNKGRCNCVLQKLKGKMSGKNDENQCLPDKKQKAKEVKLQQSSKLRRETQIMNQVGMDSSMTGKRCQSSSSSSLIMLENNPEVERKHILSKKRRHCKYVEMEKAIIEVQREILNASLSIPVRARILNQLLGGKLPNDTTLISMMGQIATSSDMCSLAPKQWIDSGVINCYVAMLTIIERKSKTNEFATVWYMPAWFQQFCEKEESSKIEVLFLDFLNDDKFGGCIKACEKICIPMNWENTHWYVCVVDMKEKRVYIYDSWPVNEYNFSRMCDVMNVRDTLHNALEFGFGSAYELDVANFPCHRPEWCPTQDNEWDCGLYAMQYMTRCKDMRRGINIHFHSEEKRCEVALELFLNSSNASRDLSLKIWGGLDFLMN